MRHTIVFILDLVHFVNCIILHLISLYIVVTECYNLPSDVRGGTGRRKGGWSRGELWSTEEDMAKTCLRKNKAEKKEEG